MVMLPLAAVMYSPPTKLTVVVPTVPVADDKVGWMLLRLTWVSDTTGNT
jgi:hypothetical protein